MQMHLGQWIHQKLREKGIPEHELSQHAQNILVPSIRFRKEHGLTNMDERYPVELLEEKMGERVRAYLERIGKS